MVCVEMTTLALGVFEGRQDRGDEIGEAFARAGACFDEEMAFLGDGLGDGIGHFKLLRPNFVTRQHTSDGAAGAENGVMGHDCILHDLRNRHDRQKSSFEDR